MNDDIKYHCLMANLCYGKESCPDKRSDVIHGYNSSFSNIEHKTHCVRSNFCHGKKYCPDKRYGVIHGYK